MPRSLTRPDKPVRIREALGIGFGLVLVFGLSTVVLADRLALPTGDLLADAAIWLSLQIAVIGGAIALAGVLRARRLAGSEAPDPFSVRSALGLVISFGLGVSMIAMASSMLLSSPTTFAGWVLVVLGGALAALPVFMLVRHARGARGGASR